MTPSHTGTAPLSSTGSTPATPVLPNIVEHIEEQELLLQETPTPPPPTISSRNMLHFSRSWDDFDKRMSDRGFRRSETQPFTKADGSCGIHGKYFKAEAFYNHKKYFF